jgi:formylglycine-generating enzyme required for sulfatase activity
MPGDAKKPGRLRLDFGNGIVMTLVLIPAGTFLMGSPASEERRFDNEVQHQVTIGAPFYMAAHEVTQAQYRTVMGASPSEFKGDGLPVENVSWDDAAEFCRRLSSVTGRKVRLPTEAEWEYACRAGTATPFSTGATIGTDQANYDGYEVYGNGRKGVNRMQPVPAGSFPPNAWGLSDMHGNLWEWCSDWFGEYDARNGVDPQGAASGSHRVIRGGSWAGYARDCRSAFRGRETPGYRGYNLGFRVSMD